MDEARYGELLREIRPRIIETPDEHERLLSVAEGLMERGDELEEEERQVLALCVLLIEAFEANVMDEEGGADEEEDAGDDEPPAPHISLQRLMQSHGIELADIVHVFGNPQLARDAIDGKRTISRGQAKELGRFFRVPAKLFQE